MATNPHYFDVFLYADFRLGLVTVRRAAWGNYLIGIGPKQKRETGKKYPHPLPPFLLKIIGMEVTVVGTKNK